MQYSFNPWVAPYAIFCFILLFITYIFYKTKRTSLNNLATVLLVFITLMVFGNMVLGMSTDRESHMLWLIISGFFGVSVPSIYFHMALYFGKEGSVLKYPHHFIIYLPLFLLLIFAIYSPEMMISRIIESRSKDGYFISEMGPVLGAFVIYSNVGLAGIGLTTFYWKYRTTTHPHLKRSAKYLCIAPLIPATMIIFDIIIYAKDLPIYFSPNYAMYFLVGLIIAHGTLNYGMLELESKRREAVITFTSSCFAALIIMPVTLGFIILFDNIAVIFVTGTFLFIIIAMINKSLENYATRFVERLFPSLKWRDCVLEEVFLVHGSGLLIAHSKREDRDSYIDKDIVAGMLSAVQNFVNDSFSMEERETLRTLYMKNIKMMIEHSEDIYLAVIFTGYDSENIRDDLKKLMHRIEKTYGGVIKNWSGDIKEIKPLENVIMNFCSLRHAETLFH